MSCSCLANCLIARLHTDIEALLAVSIVRLGQDIIDVMENVALVKKLVVGLLEFQAPAPETQQHSKDFTLSYEMYKMTKNGVTLRKGYSCAE